MKGAIERINILAHELRGHGGVYGYPLISGFDKSLYNCTGNSARVAENLLEFGNAHIDGITAVNFGNVKGDGVSVRNFCRVWKRRAALGRTPQKAAGLSVSNPIRFRAKSRAEKARRSSMPSPTPIARTGKSNRSASATSTPPFAVPSSFVTTSSVIDTISLNVSTCAMAFCPVVASSTISTSCGAVGSRSAMTR